MFEFIFTLINDDYLIRHILIFLFLPLSGILIRYILLKTDQHWAFTYTQTSTFMILPVTSYQDFFGISIVEAIASNNYPILPNRLSYPELFNYNNNKNLFYNKDNQFKEILIKTLLNFSKIKSRTSSLRDEVIKKFDWSQMSNKYDNTFKSLIS